MGTEVHLGPLGSVGSLCGYWFPFGVSGVPVWVLGCIWGLWGQLGPCVGIGVHLGSVGSLCSYWGAFGGFGGQWGPHVGIGSRSCGFWGICGVFGGR